MQPIYSQTFTLTDMDVDRFCKMKLSTLLYYAQEVAGKHSALLGADYDALAQKGLFWAVSRHKVQISRLPLLGETITVETWPMPTTKVAFPRSVVAYDEQGNEVFRAISIWVLMDSRSRAMILPGKSGVLVEGALRGNELSVPRAILPAVLQKQQTRTVRYTDLDINGHMNNCRYPDWVLDLLPAAFHGQHEARELTLCYMSEVRENEEVALHWDLSEDGVLTVEAVRNGDQMPTAHSRVFSARVEF